MKFTAGCDEPDLLISFCHHPSIWKICKKETKQTSKSIFSDIICIILGNSKEALSMEYEKLVSLSPAELTLRNYWQNHPDTASAQPCSFEEISEILEHAFRHTDYNRQNMDSDIVEQVFIPSELDCSFVRHLRYMPVFWHKHEFFEMLCVLSGNCDNIFQRETLQMKTGDICIHSPGTVHAVRTFSDDAVLLNILIRKSTFERCFFSLMEEDCILSQFFRMAFCKTTEMPYLLFRTDNDSQIHNLILNALDEYEDRKKYRRSLLNTILSELIIRMFQGYEDSITVPSLNENSGRSADIIKILRYMQNNYSSVTMSELSSRFGYSERHLQRLIFQTSGMSFRDAIQEQKLVKAAELLRNTDLTVQAVAEQTGFQALNNFRKLFSRRYHMSPAVYRRTEHIQEAAD